MKVTYFPVGPLDRQLTGPVVDRLHGGGLGDRLAGDGLGLRKGRRGEQQDDAEHRERGEQSLHSVPPGGRCGRRRAPKHSSEYRPPDGRAQGLNRAPSCYVYDDVAYPTPTSPQHRILGVSGRCRGRADPRRLRRDEPRASTRNEGSVSVRAAPAFSGNAIGHDRGAYPARALDGGPRRHRETPLPARAGHPGQDVLLLRRPADARRHLRRDAGVRDLLQPEDEDGEDPGQLRLHPGEPGGDPEGPGRRARRSGRRRPWDHAGASRDCRFLGPDARRRLGRPRDGTGHTAPEEPR